MQEKDSTLPDTATKKLPGVTRGRTGFLLGIPLSLPRLSGILQQQVTIRVQCPLIQSRESTTPVCLGLRALGNVGLSVLIQGSAS